MEKIVIACGSAQSNILRPSCCNTPLSPYSVLVIITGKVIRARGKIKGDFFSVSYLESDTSIDAFEGKLDFAILINGNVCKTDDSVVRNKANKLRRQSCSR